MFSRGQVNLDYLVTYGWALVLFGSVVSTLFFVLAPDSETIFFSSSTKDFIVKSSDVGSGSNAKYSIQLQNVSERPITITKIESTAFEFDAPYKDCIISSCSILVLSGQVMLVTGTVNTMVYHDSGRIYVEYKIDNSPYYARAMVLSAKGRIRDAASTLCPNGVCAAGENCPADNSACNAPQVCMQSPGNCVNGCAYNTPVAMCSESPGCTVGFGCNDVYCACDGSGNCDSAANLGC